MSDVEGNFDNRGFFRALEATVLARGLKWKDVSTGTGISTSTLSRMAQGKGPDAAGLAVLSAWAGLNPAEFTSLAGEAAKPEPLAQLTALIRKDPRLTDQAASTLEEVVKATYFQLTRSP